MGAHTVGILALQGDFARHRDCLEKLGANVGLVKTAADLRGFDALVVPGGESTTMLTLLDAAFFGELQHFARSKPVFGICAGAILLAREVHGPQQLSLNAIDITVRRNAYGRQLQSSIQQGTLRGSPIEMVFIRAPRIESVGPGVEVIAQHAGDPVLVRQGRVMAATFHPELTDDTRVFEILLSAQRE
jgi:5'-phosphate synthase pdxT subunit